MSTEVTMDHADTCGATYTPGPWYVRTLNGHGFDQVHAGHDDFCIADVDMVNGTRGLASVGLYDGTRKPKHGELEANARLISAAPELVEALQHLTDLFVSLAPLGADTEREIAVINARAALSKALGTPGSGGSDGE